MDKENNNTLGGFEAILDGFIPNRNGELPNDKDTDDNFSSEAMDEDELRDQLNNSIEGKKNKEDDTVEQQEDEDDTDDKKQKPSKKSKQVEEPTDDTEPQNVDEPADDNVVSNFFDAMAEELGWEMDEDDNKPKDVSELISYFKDVIEENSKPAYASQEIEALDNFVKQGGDIRKYFSIDAEVNLDDIDLEDENNQKIVVKQLLKEKGFSDKQIDKKISKYEDAGLLEDEAQDAIEDLKEINEQKKEQLLQEQKKQYQLYMERQQQFYDNVVTEIKGLKNIRGINIPEKDKRVLMDYILKPEADGRTKYQKDYAKGGVKNLIESAYFTMNADKLLAAAKREGNNSAVEKFKNSLKNSGVSSKSRQLNNGSDDDNIWYSAARRLRIS